MVFYYHFGCCSSSIRPFRIYSKLEHAQNLYNKLNNLSKVYFYYIHKERSHGATGCCDYPLIYKFTYDDARKCYVTSESDRII